ncbi:hypothetical protein [Glycomyces buryatensis]|uniref:tRNA nuclease CdiA C-terminal domain-containing protein n=1 Tax=Glycomyces buryatensis TaxID=2570927 RepID=A0A4S8QJ90_9ACTN|nr:hypothetical protein [Glycomyces buryatensis]THV40804.1 hypothetical protein FAB82_14240 [Glycomyces buryatensis]
MRILFKLLTVAVIGLALASKDKSGKGNGSGGTNSHGADLPANGITSANDAVEGNYKKGEVPGQGQDANGGTDADADNSANNTPTDDKGRTEPSQEPSPNNTPRGEPTEVRGSPENRRGLQRENEAAQTLAEHGYDVEQNPPRNENGKDPDYKIEGEYFDCYSPSRDDPGRIRDDISAKVKKGQADNIVLNLDDSGMNIADLRATLERKPINNLEEIKIVQNGQVIDFYPF